MTITATVINYLSDASGLNVGLVGAEPYPFLDLTKAEEEVGFLAYGDSTEVQFEFRVATDGARQSAGAPIHAHSGRRV